MAGLTPTISIKNASVWNGRTFQQRDVSIRAGKIQLRATDDEHTTIIDGTGKFLIPGLIDSHVHLLHDHDLQTFASRGITTVLDMACWPPEKWKPWRGKAASSDFRTAGVPATCPRSKHAMLFGSSLTKYLVQHPSEVAEWVADRVSEGSDYIKIIADTPIGPSPELLRCLVEQAHVRGKRVIAHAVTRDAFRMALHAGADILTHAPMDEPLLETDVRDMKTAGCVAIPTLVLEKGRCAAFSQDFEASLESVRMIHRSGIKILTGTDATGSDGPFPLPYGTSLYEELELLTSIGMDVPEVINAASAVAADVFDLADRGTIGEGKRADMVLLSRDPLTDVRNLRGIERVWCAGIEVEPAPLH